MKFQKGHKINLKHGNTKNGKRTKIYRVWERMRQRCNNPNDSHYKDWGARGITVCERWNNFENFLSDMGESPDGLVLDRINNDGNYEPNNCRWTNWKTSNRNRNWVKLSMEKANTIREMYLIGFKQREIANQFNVSQRMINYIVNNKNWN